MADKKIHNFGLMSDQFDCIIRSLEKACSPLDYIEESSLIIDKDCDSENDSEYFEKFNSNVIIVKTPKSVNRFE